MLVGYAVIAAVATPVFVYYLVKYVKLKGGFEAAFGAAPAAPAAAVLAAAAAAVNAADAAIGANANANAGGAAAAVPANAVNQGNYCMCILL
jgi:hypothetical protein